VAGALEQVPRLTESLLGKQEAALRALLREFRKGNQEKALRRALPLRDDRPRGPLVPGGGELPFNKLLYSLAELLKRNTRRGPGGAWYVPVDVFAELKDEYRQAATKAAQRGDYRRAAYILGKLLLDFRAAADALFQGGLYRDAAILYERKVGDHLAAARAYERCGAFDEALRIYARRGEHWAAADLLLRLGDVEAAEAEYRLAADHVAATLGELKAGEMLLDKAKRSDLARAYFLLGWQRRSGGGSVGCALHLARLYAEADERFLLENLLGEAEKFFAPAGNDSAAGQFFNLVAGLADRPNLLTLRDDLRDRSLLALAGKLRQRARVEERPGDVVAQMLGSSPAWLPAQVSDAQFAFRAAVSKLPRAQRPAATLQAGEGTVTAAAYAPGTGDVLVGFAGGEVACLHPATGSFASLPRYHLPVLSLACDHHGQIVVVLRREGRDRGEVSGYRRQGEVYVEQHRRSLQLLENAWLTPQVICHRNNYYVGLGNGTMLDLLWGPLLLPDHTLQESSPLAMAVLLSPQRIGSPPPALLLLQQGTAIFRPEERGRYKAPLSWTPQVPRGSTLTAPPLAGFLRSTDELELAGLSEDGITSWLLLAIQKGKMKLVSGIWSTEGGNQAVAIVRPGYLAAPGPSRVDWLRVEGQRFRTSRMILDMPPPVACFPSLPTGELIIVCSHGEIVRVSVPT
jgi:tetratricopeptide (TPR) repeat protein